MAVEAALLALGIVTGSVLAWIVLCIASAYLVIYAIQHLRSRKQNDLSSLSEPGERLLHEARQPKTTATVAQTDDFMGRVGDWVDRVTAALIAEDDRERLDTWTRVGWHRGRPQPRDPGEAQQYLVRPISERLAMLEGFCRDRSDAPRGSSHAGTSRPHGLDPPRESQ